jgi:hypothetical protein
MAFTPGDWSITRNGAALDVRYIGDDHGGASPSYATTIELHRALSDFADNEFDTAPDDSLSIIDQTPSDRGGVDTNITLLNGCNIDDASSQHIYDGSITQADGATIYDGIQVFGNASIIQVIQNGERIDDDFWNYTNHKAATSDAASSTTHRFMVKVRANGVDIDGRRLLGTQREIGTTYTEFFIGGGTNRGNNVLALTANVDNNNQTAAGTIATWDTITNVTEGYNEISIGGVLYPFYSEWDIGSQSKNDFFERAKWIQTRVGDIGGGNDTRDLDQVLYGLQGDIFRGVTHSITIDTPTGTFTEPEQVTWGDATDVTAGSFVVGNTYVVRSTGTTDFTLIGAAASTPGTIFTATGVGAGTGTAETITGWGQLLAIDSVTAGTECWIQLLAGVQPSDNQSIEGVSSGATALVAVTVSSETIQLPFIGSSTGAAILGSFGSGIETDDLGQNDRPIDLTGTTRTPPNNVTYTVNNIALNDYIISANNSGGDFDFTQLTTNAAYTTAGITSIVMTAAIPTDIPSSGTLRIELDTGAWRRITYDSFTGSTFTIPSTDFSGANAAASGNNAFVTYIDKQADATDDTNGFVDVTFVFDANRTLFTRVRNATPGSEIKTFETTSLVGSGGGSSTVGRIDDF